ncbi:MAG: hypothetical protein K9L22_06995 [Methylococcaceae bacterium]|nr:hypothetical protein [Methylococcaceae bacterium]
MSNEAKNINITSIEDLVNSSLDIAAEEMLKEFSSTRANIKKADQSDREALAEKKPTIKPQTELSAAAEKTINTKENIATEQEEMPEEFDLDAPLDRLDMELEPEAETEDTEAVLSQHLEPEDTNLASEQLETDLLATINQNTPIEELVQFESIEALETEVSELEAEIQLQMDKLVIKSEHLKANIQNELKRVSVDNEQLQKQVATLTQQLSEAEEKIQSLAEVQDRQQATIQKLIKILKGVNTKITHLYDEK